jgi:hypothetical protein
MGVRVTRYHEDPPSWIHVICPETGCTNGRWVTAYGETVAPQCGRHGPPRRIMIPCEACRRKPGMHEREDAR